MSEQTENLKIAAVVVTYNRRELLLQCLSHLRAQQGAACDVLVVDNAGTDGTEAAVAALGDAHILYCSTGRNIGGAGGFNYGMRRAAGAGYDCFWLMDDDTLPEPDALAELLAADRRLGGGYGFLSGVALWKDGRECRMNRPKACKRFFEHIELLGDGLLQIEQATFVSFFVRRETVEKVGLPIRDYFIWGDDIEYTRRIAVRYGLPSYTVGKSRVLHAMQDNNGSDLATEKPERLGRYRLAYRNETCTYRFEGLRGKSYFFARCVRDFFRVWKNARDHRFHRSWMIVSGRWRGRWFRPRVESLNPSQKSDTE